MKTAHAIPTDSRLVDPSQARTVAGVLGMLIRMVGPYSSLGIVLQQARSEVVSLVQSDEGATRQERMAA